MNKPVALNATFFISLLTLAASAQDGATLVEQSGVQGGVIVHLGCGDAAFTEQLLVNDRYHVQGLDTDSDKVKGARERLVKADRYGDLSIDRWDGEQLPYVDNFVNLIVAEKPEQVSEKELMRVLAPNGVLMMKRQDKWQKTVKPWPAEWMTGPITSTVPTAILPAMTRWSHRPSDCNGWAGRAGHGIMTTWPA